MSGIDGGLRGLFTKYIPEAHWQSIETGGTGRGVPDTNYCIRSPGPGARGVEGWVEFKVTSTYSVGTMRPEQVGWIHKRARYGGRVFVAVRRQHEGGPRKGHPVDELWLIEGGGIMSLAQEGLVADRVWTLHVSSGGPSAWNWLQVAAILGK